MSTAQPASRSRSPPRSAKSWPWNGAARELQAKSAAFISALAATGNFIGALKAVLRSQGVPITPAVRLPLPALTEDKLAGLAGLA